MNVNLDNPQKTEDALHRASPSNGSNHRNTMPTTRQARRIPDPVDPGQGDPGQADPNRPVSNANPKAILDVLDLVRHSPGNNLVHRQKYAETLVRQEQVRMLEKSTTAQTEQTLAIRNQTLTLDEHTRVMRLQMTALELQLESQREQTLIYRDIKDAILKIAESRPAGDAAFAMNSLKYSLIADVVAVTSHLADKVDVTAATFLEKLEGVAEGPIAEVVAKLSEREMLKTALSAFHRATDRATFEAFVRAGDLTSSDVYDEIELRCGLLLKTMLLIAAADIDGFAGDWPIPPDIDDGDPDNAPGSSRRVTGALAASTEPADAARPAKRPTASSRKR